jgi:hypothetical protein
MFILILVVEFDRQNALFDLDKVTYIYFEF